MEQVVLVDEQDKETGVMEKLQAHVEGRLHRAISVFVFNSKNELLLQQRAAGKYHSANLWTNTCCSHPRPGEDTLTAAHRRLKEEMGMACELNEKFSFIYQTPFDNGLSEHELDFVFTGIFNGTPRINASEVAAFRWISLPDLEQEIAEHPQRFTIWFKLILKEYLEHL